MIMEYAVNGSLFRYHSNLLSNNTNPSLHQVNKFISQTLSALKFMHNNDYMHRDIKVFKFLIFLSLKISFWMMV